VSGGNAAALALLLSAPDLCDFTIKRDIFDCCIKGGGGFGEIVGGGFDVHGEGSCC
jgi:hypothetical protein